VAEAQTAHEICVTPAREHDLDLLVAALPDGDVIRRHELGERLDERRVHLSALAPSEDRTHDPGQALDAEQELAARAHAAAPRSGSGGRRLSVSSTRSAASCSAVERLVNSLGAPRLTWFGPRMPPVAASPARSARRRARGGGG
jgi:hypothetical protein